MKNFIKKILREDFDWVDNVNPSLPDSSILDKKIPVTISLRDYLNTKYGYNFIDIVLEDNRVIELTLEGDYDVKYDTYNNIIELVKTQRIQTFWNNDEPTEITQYDFESYLREYDMVEVDKEVDETLRKLIPLDIKGIYVGSL
tara:strand:+ start:3708 stop:4136 length:429 start_codon:yes stop_codon:yes gene_type:complete